MKKILSIFLFFIFTIGIFLTPGLVHAQSIPPGLQLDTISNPGGEGTRWTPDPEVTFVGRNAARSGLLLDWTLRNYNWVCVSKADPSARVCDNSNNPLRTFWTRIVFNIVTPLLFLVVMAAAIILIVTRGRSITIMRFLPRFIIIVLLVAFSFSLVSFIYQFTDAIQGFFLAPPDATSTNPGDPCPPNCISNADLLFVGWPYEEFVGLRAIGDDKSEAIYTTLLLTKLTAFTYYVMWGMLTLRKIILWFFIVVSPVFPLLLFFYPVRNTAKIWIGEFFRWTLYGPLFAIFLSGLVFMWTQKIPVDISTDIGVRSQTPTTTNLAGETVPIIFPTAVNILLGGPQQFVEPANNVNKTETFALYIVALLMLWGVIIMPWILLRIFLSEAAGVGKVGSAAVNQFVGKVRNKIGPSPGKSPDGGGRALNLPFAKKFSPPTPPAGGAGLAREIPRDVSESRAAKNVYMPSAQVKAQVLTAANVNLPTLRDIAKYDSSLMNRDQQGEITRLRQNLSKIANPASSSTSTEREKYTQIREKLTRESMSGNILATSILNAANSATRHTAQVTTTQVRSMLSQVANPQSATTPVINREKLESMNRSLTKAKEEGNSLAIAALSVTDKTSEAEVEKLQERIRTAREKQDPIALELSELTDQKSSIPAVNRVQTVSRADYEAVKDLWKENYHNQEVPQQMGSRTEWIKKDTEKIENIIKLLSSQNEEEVTKGVGEVSDILPFLLVGGFSQTEIVSYLKAKEEAGQEMVKQLEKEEEEKVVVKVGKKTEQKEQAMHMEQTIPDEENKPGGTSSSPAEPEDALVGVENQSQEQRDQDKQSNNDDSADKK